MTSQSTEIKVIGDRFQDFTQEQSIFTIRTQEDVILNGNINNIDLVNRVGLTQFKDQPITFKTASFGAYTNNKFQQLCMLTIMTSTAVYLPFQRHFRATPFNKISNVRFFSTCNLPTTNNSEWTSRWYQVS